MSEIESCTSYSFREEKKEFAKLDISQVEMQLYRLASGEHFVHFLNGLNHIFYE